MATARLIHGFIGAGKTTLARRLEAETGAIRFTHDEWMRRLYGRDPPEATFAESFRRVADLMEEVWTRCLSAGADVVLDSGLWQRTERDRVRGIVRRLGAECRLYASPAPTRPPGGALRHAMPDPTTV
ncbi:AAA family ATPase [Aureimonas leprariae]|uniref:AAA family ATPase n=1 Tax=Plantimonas leprariae TaxID=2615207 RepID=A0A7V7PNZ0_9HYPH|nr:AAA family ATPase [Aureimonas leprariae]KAB0679629.1 AAA family ATPase [Aureimonas leprariae]